MTDINSLLQAVRVHLLNEALLSRSSVQEQEQLWETFLSILLETPIDQLSDKFRLARFRWEELQDEQSAKELLSALSDRQQDN
jgi:hypothetical protein